MIREKGLPRYTSRTIFDDEEYIPCIKAVAVALDNRKGPSLAVWVVGLSNTMGSTKIQQVVDVILNTTNKLRLALEDSQ